MILNVSLDLPGDGAYLRIARRIGRTLLEDLGVVDDDIFDTEFVVGELCSNVVRHARVQDGRFLVALEYHADKVVITVEDRGVGFAFKDVLPVGTTRADGHDGGERIGGFGLDLVKQLSDQLEFRRHDTEGTKVRAEKHLHYKTVAEAQEAAALDRPESGSISISQS